LFTKYFKTRSPIKHFGDDRKRIFSYCVIWVKKGGKKMRLMMKERKAVTKGLAGQYRRARKANKKILLNSFTEATQEVLEKSVTANRVLRERKKGVESHMTSLL
jgi:hypothetical protein